MESEIFVCKHCGKEHEAMTQEIASYSCPNLPKTKTKLKMLDSVRLKYLTKVNSSSQTQDPHTNENEKTDAESDNGDHNGKEKIK